MRIVKFGISVLLAAMSLLVVGCAHDELPDNRERDYGYVQFKLYKEASYDKQACSTRAVVGQLDLLSQACKVKVSLEYGDMDIVQTLALFSASQEAAEEGLRSDHLKLLTGEYRMVGYTLYDSSDEQLYIGTVAEPSTFTVIEGGLTVHDITVNVKPRGKVRFSLVKSMEGLKPVKAAASESYTFDQAEYASITVRELYASGALGAATRFEKLPCDFSVHFEENGDDADGYQTSSSKCDSLLSLPAGRYRVTAYEVFDDRKISLEENTSPELVEFDVEDNRLTDVDVKVTLDKEAEYIRDYRALKAIWESLGGPQWSYYGEEWPKGANWNFNKDVDLWGDQPGVALHANGRVARVDLSNFGFGGAMPEQLGQLTELVELYLGTHNDTNLLAFDPLLDSGKSLLERKRDRMKDHGDYLRLIHPAVQFSEPCARALEQHSISIEATSLYKSMSEESIIDRATGAQRTIRPHDTNHGTICNRLESLPESIGNLAKLEILYIANSTISALPKSMEKLVACTDLEIYNCPNLKFPLEIAAMPELVSLNLSNNNWDADDMLAGLRALASGPSGKKIQILYGRENRLAVIPREMRNMEKLGLLDLAYNEIATIEEPFGRSVSFTQLYLDNNLLTDEQFRVDATDGYFCGYDDVETFSVKFNRLTKVPNIFSAKSQYTMSSVDFSGNQIDGFALNAEGKYDGIRVNTLTLAQNKFKSYPKALADSNSSVAYIILRANEIEKIEKGSFDYENSPMLMSLDLSYNRLSDLPDEMNATHLPYLYGVELSYNRFSEFPFEPLDSYYLTVLGVRCQRDANGARCLREWPTGIYNHTALRALYLGSNDLGVINDTISYLIYYLDISDNPNIVFDASDICASWLAGTYFLIYDKTQDIRNCDYMLE
ncbi:MAG: DUF4458 domain-containing protein [Alistipes sp.]|nr:DUF4458 domain-containing protein [Alistipes sp.]